MSGKVLCNSCNEKNDEIAKLCQNCGKKLILPDSLGYLSNDQNTVKDAIAYILTAPQHQFSRLLILFIGSAYLWLIVYLFQAINLRYILQEPSIFRLLSSVNILKSSLIIIYLFVPFVIGFYKYKRPPKYKTKPVSNILHQSVILFVVGFFLFLFLQFIDTSIYNIYSENQFPTSSEYALAYLDIFLTLSTYIIILTLSFGLIFAWFIKYYYPNLVRPEQNIF